MKIHQLGADGVELFKKEHKTFLLTVLDGNRDPIDLAGSEITLTVRPDICDDRVSITKSSIYTTQIQFILPTTNGQAYVHFRPEDTENLDHGTYAYDVWIKLPNDKEMVVIEPSPFEIKPAITEILGGQAEEDISNISFSDLITNATMNIYVRAVDGSDTNAGTITAPLKTIAAALALIPHIVNHQIIIHLGAHTGYGYEWPIFTERTGSGAIWVVGDGGGKAGNDGFTEVVPSTVALAGSTNELIKSSGLDATKRGGAGALLGLTVEILDGAAWGDRRDIAYNTATDIVPVAPFSAAVAPGDHYRIVKPSIHVNLGYDGVTQEPIRARGSAKLYLVNLWFAEGAIPYGTYCYMPDCNVVLFGAKADRDFLFVGPNSNLSFGGEEFTNSTLLNCGSEATVTVLGARQKSSWFGWGIANLSELNNWCFLWLMDVNARGFCAAGRINLSSFFGYSDLHLTGGTIWHSISTAKDSFCYLASWFSSMAIGTPATGSNVAIFVEGNLYISGIGVFVGLPTTPGTTRGAVAAKQGRISIYGSCATFKCTVGGIATKYQGLIEVQGVPTMDCGGNDFSEDNGAHWRPISDLGVGDAYADTVHGLIFREY